MCREDVRQGTQKAARATELLGSVPQAVLEATLRAAHAPDIRPVMTGPSAPRQMDDEAALDTLGDDEPLVLGGHPA